MPECKTVDDMIEALTRIKSRVGGSAPLFLGHDLLHPEIRMALLGKGTQRKTVSRGGTPCVIIVG